MLSLDLQKQAVTAVTRLFIFKSCRKEHIQRKLVSDIVVKLDPVLTKHTNIIIDEVRKNLSNNFGLNLIYESSRTGSTKVDKSRSKMLVSNELLSPKLFECLAEKNRKASYMGFCYVVMLAIFTHPGRKISVENLTKCLRLVDKRFPETIMNTRKSDKVSAVAVPELGMDLLSLLAQMKKVRLI
jgi:hypothetical protein